MIWKILQKFTGKTLQQSLFLSNVAACRLTFSYNLFFEHLWAAASKSHCSEDKYFGARFLKDFQVVFKFIRCVEEIFQKCLKIPGKIFIMRLIFLTNLTLGILRSSCLNVFYKKPVFKHQAKSDLVTLLKRDSVIGVSL